VGDTMQATTTQGVMIHSEKQPGMKRRIKRSPLEKNAETETREVKQPTVPTNRSRRHHPTKPSDV
jgi:hypothetical protein